MTVQLVPLLTRLDLVSPKAFFSRRCYSTAVFPVSLRPKRFLFSRGNGWHKVFYIDDLMNFAGRQFGWKPKFYPRLSEARVHNYTLILCKAMNCKSWAFCERNNDVQ